MHPYNQDSVRAPNNPIYPASPSSRKTIKLGILLCEAQLISSDDLQKALMQADFNSKKLGQVLIEANKINTLDLENALIAQSMIQDSLIERKSAAGALKCAKDNNLPFAQVTKWLSKSGNSVNEQEEILIELMLAANLVQETSIEEARRISLEREITVLGALLKMRAVSFSTVNIVVECLKLVLDKKIDISKASKILRIMKEQNCDFAYALEMSGMKAKNTLSKIKIGDILLSAKVVTEADLLNCLEKSFSDKRMLGELLIEAGILSKDLLDEALFLQKLCKKDLISRQLTARVIRKAYESNCSAKKVTCELKAFQDDSDTANSAVKLLYSANLTNEDTAIAVVGHFSEYDMDALNALVAGGEISTQVYRASIELARLLDRKLISKEVALKVLYHCDLTKCDFKDSFRELGMDSLETLDQQITTGVQSKLSLPEFHKSKELIFLAITLVIAISVTLVINHHLPQILVALMAGVIVVIASLLAYFTIQSRQEQVKACQIQMSEKTEEAKQEVARLRQFGKR